MTDKTITLEIDVVSAATARQILFESQKGYTYDEVSVPPRITDIRNVIQDIDNSIGEALSV